MAELKKLEVAVAEARSEASKAEEVLEELAALRAFLDGLTPAHHFQVLPRPRANAAVLVTHSIHADSHQWCDAVRVCNSRHFRHRLLAP